MNWSPDKSIPDICNTTVNSRLILEAGVVVVVKLVPPLEGTPSFRVVVQVYKGFVELLPHATVL